MISHMADQSVGKEEAIKSPSPSPTPSPTPNPSSVKPNVNSNNNLNLNMNIGMGIGPNVGQEQIDEIEDLQSPPNSPGLVLPAMIPSTNDKIDFFALDAKNDGKSLPFNKVITEQRYGGIQDRIKAEKDTEQVLGSGIKLGLNDSNKNTASKPPSRSSQSNVTNDESSMNLTASSDSYFSRSRKTRTPTSKSAAAYRERRMSDMSDRSDYYGSVASFGSNDSGSYTGSDTEITGSPTMKYVNRKKNVSKYQYVNAANETNEIGTHSRTTGRSLQSGQFDDGIVFRTISNTSSLPNSESEYNFSLPESRPSSSYGFGFDTNTHTPTHSRTRVTRGRRRSAASSDDGSSIKEGGKREDNTNRDKRYTSTAQIFKNLLILEESLRQQFAEQQKLRFKYTIFLSGLLAVFIYSAYMTTMHSLYSFEGFKSGTIDGTVAQYYDVEKYANAAAASGMESIGITASVSAPEFPTMAEEYFQQGHGESSDVYGGGNGGSGDEGGFFPPAPEGIMDGDIEGGVLTKNTVYRVVSIITGMTLLLFYLTGEYARTISRPRKFLATANKGIRQLNVRLVKVKVSYREQAAALLPWWRHKQQQHQHNQQQHHHQHEVLLVLNPRVFSTGAREQWELYRSQFWSLALGAAES